MVAIQVRDVSQETRDALAGEAERRGQSLQFFLSEILEREAASARNVARVEAARGRKPMIKGNVSVRELIEQGNEERTQQILAAVLRE